MDFASRISVLCFAASYAVGLAFECLRLLAPQRWVRWLATGAAVAGLCAQTLFLASIVVREHRPPIDTQFESLITVSWLVGLVYLYLLLRDRRLGAGLFLLPVILGVVLFAGSLTDRAHRPAERVNQTLAVAHGLLLLVGTAFVVVALAAAVMYLVKVRQLRSGPFSKLRLPSLERLERLNTVTVYIAWPLLTLGIGLGFALRQLSFNDPKVTSTLVAWVLFTILAHMRYQPINRGRKVAIVTVFACLVVLFSVLGDPIFGTSHQATGGVLP